MRILSDNYDNSTKTNFKDDTSREVSPFSSHHLHQYRQEVSETTGGQDPQPEVQQGKFSQKHRQVGNMLAFPNSYIPI